MPASCWSVSCCVCACAPRPIGHLGNAVFSFQLSVISWKKNRSHSEAFSYQLQVGRYGRIQKPSAFSLQFSVISANREGRANRDAFRGQLLVASPLEEEAELPQRHGGAEKKPISGKGSPPGALYFYPLLPF